jgi:hypothetical protein
MMIIFYLTLVTLLIYHMFKRLDYNKLSTYIILGFIFTGGFQTILILVGISSIDEFGLLSSRVSSYKPNGLDIAILLKSIFVWFLYYLAIYVGFTLTFGSLKFDILYKNFIRKVEKIGVIKFKRRVFKLIFAALFLSIFIELLQILEKPPFYETINQLSKYFTILAMTNLLLIYSHIKSSKKTIIAIFALYTLSIILSNIDSGARGSIFSSMVVFLIILVSVYGVKINFRKNKIALMTMFIFMLVVFILSSMFKFNGFFDFVSIESILFNNDRIYDFLVYLLEATVERLNNMHALYWYYYDIDNGIESTFQDINLTFISLINNITPSFIVDLSSFREVQGMPIEQWLFYQSTGGNSKGGMSLPVIVEALWVTRSQFFSLIVVLLLYAIIGLFFRFFRKKIAILPIICISLFSTFINPESIELVFYDLARGLLVAIFIQYLLTTKFRYGKR